MKKRVFLLFVLLLSIFSPSFAEEDEETTIEKEIKAVITLKEVIGDYRQEGENKIICLTNTCTVDLNGNNSIGENLSYHWDFGNGKTYTSQNPQKKDFEYKEGGYTISLKVSEVEKIDIAYFYINFEIQQENSDNGEFLDYENSGDLEEKIIENGNNDNSGTVNEDLGNNIENISVKYVFQSPTYLVEKDDDFTEKDLIFNCDRSKDDCRINFNFEDTFTGSLKKNDFVCLIDFGLGGITGEEEKCNPNTVIFPIGKTEIKVKITSKNDENYFGELKFAIINDGKLASTSGNTYITYSSNSSDSSTKSQLILSTPTIKIQSGLDSNNKCDKSECSVNFTYEPTEYKTTEIICKWDFGEGIYTDLNEEKCNPTYVKYGPGKHKVVLEICDENYDWNCKVGSFEFENIYNNSNTENGDLEDFETILEEDDTNSSGKTEKIEVNAKITLQGRQAKTKIVEENKITCVGVESCSVNFTGENSTGEKLKYYWDFGNGKVFEGKNPTSQVFDTGEYSVILEIVDIYGETFNTIFDVIVTGELQEEELEKYTIVEEELFLSSGNSENLEQKIEEIPKLEIELQGKIGSNKILNGNKLTCIKTCSVNFDGSKSVGKFSVYFWDFGNGETFEGKNPGYISYENFGEYMVLFSGETKEGSLYEEEFYINFVEKESSTKEEKVELNLINLSFADDEETEILAEFGGIDYNEDEENRNEENGKHFGKYIILVMIILGLLGGFALLRRYDILKK